MNEISLAANPTGTAEQPTQRPRGCTNYKLRQLLRAVSRLYDAEMHRAGIKTTQFSLLSNIAAAAPAQPNTLAERMGMDASTMTRNLRVLIDHGWVESGPGTDARSRRVMLTPAGQEKLNEARHYWKRAQLALNERFGDTQVAALHELIDLGLERLA